MGETETGKIIWRSSISTFLAHYQSFCYGAASLSFPFSASVLLSQAIFSSKYVAGDVDPVSVHSFKLRRAVFSIISTLPFAVSFLLLSKASVVLSLHHQKSLFPPPFFSISRTYRHLLLTYIIVTIAVESAIITFLCLELVSLHLLRGVRLSSSTCHLLLIAASFFQLIVHVYGHLLSNLALILSAKGDSEGVESVSRTFKMIRRKLPEMIFLALPITLGFYGIEELFNYRIVRSSCRSPTRTGDASTPMIILESIFIAYLHSCLVVLDTVAGYVFLQRCVSNYLPPEHGHRLDALLP